MAINAYTIMLLLALISFLLSMIEFPQLKINLVSLGLVFLTVAFLVRSTP